MSIFRKSETRSAEEPLPGVIPPAREVSARAVTTGDAVSLSAVYRALSIYTTAVRQCSVDAFRGDVQVDAPAAFIRQPNVDQSRGSFLEQTVLSLLTSGNSYWRVERDSSGRVVNLTVLNPHDVEPKVDAAGRVTAFSYGTRDYRPNEIQHLAVMRLPGRSKGLGPIQAAQQELRGALDTQGYASNWFDKSGLPSGGYWSTKEPLNADQAATAREALTKATANREGTALVGNGLELKPFALSPEDAQWIEVQRFNVTQIARLFGVPSSLMLAALDGAPQAYQNVSQEMTQWAKFGLMQFLSEIEEAFTSLLPRGQKAVFNLEALLRADTRSRYEAHEIAIRSGIYTVDEVRAIEGLPPLPKPEPAPVEPEPAPELTEEVSEDERP